VMPAFAAGLAMPLHHGRVVAVRLGALAARLAAIAAVLAVAVLVATSHGPVAGRAILAAASGAPAAKEEAGEAE